jgi:hypothetical protein
MTSKLFIEDQVGMYFSIAWGLNPRLLSIMGGNKLQK